jgi:hypothetical protein
MQFLGWKWRATPRIVGRSAWWPTRQFGDCRRDAVRRRVCSGVLVPRLALGVIWGGAKPEKRKSGTPEQGGIAWGDRAPAVVIWDCRARAVWGS